VGGLEHDRILGRHLVEPRRAAHRHAAVPAALQGAPVVGQEVEQHAQRHAALHCRHQRRLVHLYGKVCRQGDVRLVPEHCCGLVSAQAGCPLSSGHRRRQFLDMHVACKACQCESGGKYLGQHDVFGSLWPQRRCCVATCTIAKAAHANGWQAATGGSGLGLRGMQSEHISVGSRQHSQRTDSCHSRRQCLSVCEA